MTITQLMEHQLMIFLAVMEGVIQSMVMLAMTSYTEVQVMTGWKAVPATIHTFGI